jgi:hypothetical protein
MYNERKVKMITARDAVRMTENAKSKIHQEFLSKVDLIKYIENKIMGMAKAGMNYCYLDVDETKDARNYVDEIILWLKNQGFKAKLYRGTATNWEVFIEW